VSFALRGYDDPGLGQRVREHKERLLAFSRAYPRSACYAWTARCMGGLTAPAFDSTLAGMGRSAAMRTDRADPGLDP
jgi:hypothetical protein